MKAMSIKLTQAKYWFFSYIIILMLSFVLVQESRSSMQSPTQKQITIVYLYNFLKFAKWPDHFSKDSEPFIINILGNDPFGQLLDYLRGKTVRGRKIEVVKVHDINLINQCHLLFISSSEADNMNIIVSSLEEKPILTISNIPGFIDNGGMIGLKIINDKIRFEINNSLARRHELKLSSKLLELALKVH
jgi:surface polysaccharide O-acyltransferase-like enzyme